MYEADLYIEAPIALAWREDFYVCWYDPDTQESGQVLGEYGSEWTEVHEMTTHFNAEGDGLFYYVGDRNGTPLKPSYAEVKRVVHFATEHQLGLTPSDELALELLFG